MNSSQIWVSPILLKVRNKIHYKQLSFCRVVQQGIGLLWCWTPETSSGSHGFPGARKGLFCGHAHNNLVFTVELYLISSAKSDSDNPLRMPRGPLDTTLHFPLHPTDLTLCGVWGRAELHRSDPLPPSPLTLH